MSCENETLNPLTKEEKEGLSWSVKHDYKKILKLQKSLSEIKSEPVSPEESVAQSQEEKMEPKLSEEKFQELWKRVKLGGGNNGKGSFGTVYSVRDEVSGKDYIIKVPNFFSQLSKYKSSDPEFFASLKKDIIVPPMQEEEKGNIVLYAKLAELDKENEKYLKAELYPIGKYIYLFFNYEDYGEELVIPPGTSYEEEDKLRDEYNKESRAYYLSNNTNFINQLGLDNLTDYVHISQFYSYVTYEIDINEYVYNVENQLKKLENNNKKHRFCDAFDNK